jgi:hypothetical protein
MSNDRGRAVAVVGAAVSALALSAVLNSAPAHAAPLPGFCGPSNTVDNVCAVRLQSVYSNAVDGTITGIPAGGGAPVVLSGERDAYLKSTGFGGAPPDVVQRWDTTLDQTNGLSTDSSEPNWYGNAKAQAFLPRTLNDMATEFPPDVLVVKFTSEDAQGGSMKMVSIQPTAQ